MKKTKALVAILMGSTSDSDTVKGCAQVLDQYGVGYEVKVLSAHRTPKETTQYVESAKPRGIQVLIAAAGGAAHLAGVVAAHTDLPVLGIPVESKSLKGLDSLLSTVQMPPGVPVGCLAIGLGGAKNAAHLAVRILALKNSTLALRVKLFKSKMRTEVLKKKVKF
jgi:5-(carboxyamino)imidazole ribonucleotide mutase